MLVLDAILTGAKGINLWSSFRTPPPQRSARLYRALVERRLASAVGAGLLPTEHPFLYLISATAMDGVSLQDVESAATAALDDVVRDGITERELVKAKNQLRARLVFENDSVTNLGHQLGILSDRGEPRRLSGRAEPHRRGDAGSGGQRREEISANRSADGRLVQADRRSAGMTTAVQKGLAASRHVLDNGTVVISKAGAHGSGRDDSGRREGGQHLRFECARRASAISRRACSTAAPGDRTTDEIAEALDERGVSLSRRREPPRDERQLHVPLGRLRGDARAGRRDRDAAGVSRSGDRDTQGRSAERDSAGRRQPCGHGDAGALHDAVSESASVRPSVEGQRRQRQPDRAEGSRRVSRRALCAVDDDGGDRRRCRARAGGRRSRARVRVVAEIRGGGHHAAASARGSLATRSA